MSRSLLALLLVLACAAGAGASGADFTASSSSTGNTYAAAADFNTVSVSLGALASTLTGSVPVSATATSGRGIASVKFQSAPAGTSDWVDICTVTGPFSCSWNTPALADGSYDVRAVATDNAGYSRTSTITARSLDNYTLAATLADPGANISGTVALNVTATGIAGSLVSLTVQQRAPGATTWNDVCTGTTTPLPCSFDTTAYAEGGRELRAIATDTSGATAISAVRTPNIDNSPPATTPSIPSSGTGTVSMSATADDSGSGISYVDFEALYGGVWYPFCHDTSAPYTCSGDSAQVPDGTYQIRVVVVNNAGVKTTSSPTSITIDNPPAPADVQAGNVTAGTPGLLEADDWVRLTWSEQIAPGSVLSGWNGSGQAILVKVADNLSNDTMDFYNAAGTTRLNLTGVPADLKLGGNFVSGAVNFNATMTQSGSSITVTLGAPVGTPTLPTAAASTMTWAPSSAAADLTGHASRTNTVSETGGLDVDF